MARLGAIILTGGGSTRMGADKAALDWGGRRAVDRVADLAKAAGAQSIVTVGPGQYGFANVSDESPLGGPVGGIVAGVTALLREGCGRAVALAVDSPTIWADDLTPLLSAPSPGAAFDGFPLPLVFDLAAVPTSALADWPIARLIDQAGLARLVCPAGAQDRLRGANTPAEREALLAGLARTSRLEAESRR